MALRFVVGVLIGGIVAAGFLFILDASGDEPAVVASPSSTTVVGAATIAATTTTTTEAPWVRAGEARFESTVLLPVAMWVDGGVATLEYDLVTLGPVLAGTSPNTIII